jgi:hypothetical protein
MGEILEKRAGEWSYEELLRVLCLYASLDVEHRSKVPKGLIQDVQILMRQRTLASIQMRIANYVARDPEMRARGVKGMFGGGVHVDAIWRQCSDESGNLDLQKIALEAAIFLGK